uniref:Cytochrome c oxidase subunit 3 n=1 Tax=Cantacader sp. TaxID=2931283 RepID=A0A8T9ZZ20_9HEMI|nr:cytochrome c oxidase subunit III [Cantacader sp.]
MKMINNHPFHLVNNSPWPLTGAIAAMTMTSGLTLLFKTNNKLLIMLSIPITLLTMMQWWRDIIREATNQGLHTNMVVKGLKLGMILFIISEIMLFIAFFWAFFHSSLSPTIELGMNWPPNSIFTFNPMQIPLLNTMILLSSGISITWTHHSLMNKNHNEAKWSLIITITLAIYFTILQAIEYMESSFTISDSVYGSCFFMATGLHGFHVMVGTTFLIICLMRHTKFNFSSTHHFGFEAAAWYWHFVDIVWMFLYISIYWWGS